MLKVTIFLLATITLAWVSRSSFSIRSSHGFFRFFAWEAIVVLCLVVFRGLGPWFADPLAPRQVASWILLCSSLVALAAGLYSLLTLGHADPGAEREGPLVGLERTTALVTTGGYRYIRHPMYASLLYLAWGVFLKRPGWIAALLALLATGLLFATARAEEAEDIRYFGQPYRAYMGRTKMFVPFVL